MACPYFDPVEPRTSSPSSQTAMLPLGELWTGWCRASAEVPWQPDDGMLRTPCGLGYARGNCSRFPSGDSPDAVRFTISRDQEDTIVVSFMVERDHRPDQHGTLEYSRAQGRLAGGISDGILMHQAQAYVQSYLRRKSV